MTKARQLLRRWKEGWPLRTLLAGAVCSGLDYATMILLVHFAHLWTLLASIIGVLVGGAANFVLNKYFAFRNRDRHVGRQLFFYILTMAGALVAYAGLFYLLTSVLRLYYVIAKLVCDLLIFGIGAMLANRYRVFPRKSRRGA